MGFVGLFCTTLWTKYYGWQTNKEDLFFVKGLSFIFWPVVLLIMSASLIFDYFDKLATSIIYRMD